MLPLSFSYRLKRWPVLLLIPAVAAMTFHFYSKPADPSGVVSLFHLVELSGPAAGAFHMLGLAFCGLALVFMVLGLLVSFGPARVIELRDEGACLPRSAFSARVVEVPYHRIYRLEVQQLGRQKILHIGHVGGKIALTSTALHDQTAFEQIVRILSQKSCVTPQFVRVT